ncbi:MAG: hypothetical protein GF405_01005 [Candidatus Eisenbacteria bacterium]|nr:hypothetical protein [Candidatus Eisenbacteria bacterium]
MNLRRAAAAAALLVLLLSTSCGVVGPSGSGTRPFAMGFTPTPHALTTEGVYSAWDRIRGDGDLAVIHYDGGVPWAEALIGAYESYPVEFKDGIDFNAQELALTPGGHAVYVAVTPISWLRDELAGYPDDGGLPFPWSTYDFDDPDVIEAFTNHCEFMIDTYDPDFFCYGIEVNILRWNSPELWDDFVGLCAGVYPALKSEYPGLPIFLSFHADTYFAAVTDQESAIEDVLPYTDMMTLSGYPFAAPLEDPELVRFDYFSALADLAPEKPFAVAETGWPAEDVTSPYPLTIEATETDQTVYVYRLLDECFFLNAVFVNWFVSRDYDEWWEDELKFSPDAYILRLWKDCGLYRGDGSQRPSLGAWYQYLALEREY